MKHVPESLSSVGFFKLCYVDINKSTNVDQLFSYYMNSMLKLKASHPEINVVLLLSQSLEFKKAGKQSSKRFWAKHHLDTLKI